MIQEKSDKVQQNTDNGVQALNELIVDAIQDIKGKNLVLIDLRAVEDAPASYFIICDGDSTTQVSGISDNIVKRVKDEMGVYPNHKEGMDNSRWVLVDYFDTVVHVFYHETRQYYDLDDLWSDGKVTQYANL